jgi:selenophosphate synthase
MCDSTGGVERAIGDDAAAFVVPSEGLTLVTTDLLVERVHFLRDATTPFNLGYKAMAVNLSDIAAMGGTPREAFVSADGFQYDRLDLCSYRLFPFQGRPTGHGKEYYKSGISFAEYGT